MAPESWGQSCVVFLFPNFLFFSLGEVEIQRGEVIFSREQYVPKLGPLNSWSLLSVIMGKRSSAELGDPKQF